MTVTNNISFIFTIITTTAIITIITITTIVSINTIVSLHTKYLQHGLPAGAVAPSTRLGVAVHTARLHNLLLLSLLIDHCYCHFLVVKVKILTCS